MMESAVRGIVDLKIVLAHFLKLNASFVFQLIAGFRCTFCFEDPVL